MIIHNYNNNINNNNNNNNKIDKSKILINLLFILFF